MPDLINAFDSSQDNEAGGPWRNSAQMRWQMCSHGSKAEHGQENGSSLCKFQSVPSAITCLVSVALLAAFLASA